MKGREGLKESLRLEGVFRAIKLRFEPGLNLGLKLGLNLGLTWISTWLEPGFRLRAQIFCCDR